MFILYVYIIGMAHVFVYGRLLKLSFSVRFEVQSIINFGLHNGDWGELYCWYVQNDGGDAGTLQQYATKH